MTDTIIDPTIVEASNAKLAANLRTDYDSLAERLDRRGVKIDAIKAKIAKFSVAVPSWGVGTGGTRFARFPGIGEPRDIFDKIEDCAVISQLTQATKTVSLHIPWDKADPNRLKQAAARFGLGFDAMNSNTFADAKGQLQSYKFGSLAAYQAETRSQAIEHNLECIEIGQTIGSKALTVWIGDGSNFPGQVNFTTQFEHYLDAMKVIYAELPDDWRLFTEHKMYEPAFYSSVV
ncbi:MAG TPA: sugar isomerase, partial [Devosia sp.]|nr:sugar isomerase [Devosia sp.]